VGIAMSAGCLFVAVAGLIDQELEVFLGVQERPLGSEGMEIYIQAIKRSSQIKQEINL